MKQDQINYDKLLSALEKTVSSYDFYLQSILLCLCFIATYFFARITKKHLRAASSTIKKNPALGSFVFLYLNPLLFPVIAVVLLSVGISIYAQFFSEVILFSTTLKLVALFTLIRFIRISSGSSFIANAAGIFLMPTLVLDIFGMLDPVIDYLDKYALKIGSVRISIYLIFKSFIVLLILFWLSGLISKKTKSYIEGSKSIKSSTKSILSKLIDILIYSIIIITLLKTFGVDMTTFAVIGGAIGVGIGFGLQKIASNFISGIILLLEKSVEIGDLIELDNGNIFGTVKHFGGRYAAIESFDGKEIMVPNEDFIVGKVTNWTYSNNRARIEIIVGVAYDSDLEKVREIMIEAARENPRCVSYPSIECYLSSFGDHDIKFILYFWISDIIEGRLGPKSEVMMNIWKKFKENNIKIPLPQREVRVVEEKNSRYSQIS